MLKPTLIVLALLSTQNVFANRINECEKPGVKLSNRLIGIVGDQKDLRFERLGTSDILSTAKFEAKATTNTYQIFEAKYCEIENYSYEQKECKAIDLAIALGRGNAEFKSLYDLNKTIMNRAQLFAKKVLFNAADASEVRLETAKKIVILLVGKAASSEIPAHWDDLVIHLNALVAEGKLETLLVDEIIRVNELANKKSLGFLPLAEAIITEKSGNAEFKSLFDLSKTEANRIKVLQKIFYSSEKTLKGQVLSEVTTLARFLIEYASINGIPESWDQVTLMLKEAATRKILTNESARTMYRVEEVKNRSNAGFQAEASKCEMVKKDASVNVIRAKSEKQFYKEVSQSFTINTLNAPLLSGEREVYYLRYSGDVSSSRIFTESRFNSYTYTANIQNDALNFDLTGTRIKINPTNNLAGNLVNVGGIVDIMIQNKNYNPKIDGKITVLATFFETRFLFDTELGSRTIEPKDGNLVKYLSQIKAQNPGRQIYAKVKIKYENSSYYNNNYSETIILK